MNKKKFILDEIGRKFVKDEFGTDCVKIVANLSDDDLKGIDFTVNDTNCSLRVRDDDIHLKYGYDITWTERWKDGKLGEFHYGEDIYRLNIWTSGGKVDVATLVFAPKHIRIELFTKGYTSPLNNTTNGQKFIKVSYEIFQRFNLVAAQWTLQEGWQLPKFTEHEIVPELIEYKAVNKPE